MQIDERYKDVTFETVNEAGFVEPRKKGFRGVNWDKAYHEFLAAGESAPDLA